MHAFTRAMAREWAPFGIRVNALAPGTIDTDMVRNNPPEAQAAAWPRRADEAAPRTPTRWSAPRSCSSPTPAASSPAKSWLPTAAS